jgi:hypothetical protein
LPKQADKIMADTIKDLNRETQKALQQGKDQDVKALSQLVKDLETEVLKRKSGADWLKWRQQLVLHNVCGRWSRVDHEHMYDFQTQAKCRAFATNQAVLTEGTLTGMTGDDVVICRWDNGLEWHLHPAGDNVIAVKEINGKKEAGFMLERQGARRPLKVVP